MSRIDRRTTFKCNTIDEFGSAWFNISSPCGSNDVHCTDINFKIELHKTDVKCTGLKIIYISMYFSNKHETCNFNLTENDCRYPDQVRFLMGHSGLHCDVDEHNSNNDGNILDSFKLGFFILTLATVILNIRTIF